METRFFQLLDEHGLDPDGSPQPIAKVSVLVVTPVMVGDEIADETQSLVIEPAPELSAAEAVLARVIPDTRLVETADQRIAEGLLACSQYVEIDAPNKKTIDAAAKATATHRARAEAGELAPDAPEGAPNEEV